MLPLQGHTNFLSRHKQIALSGKSVKSCPDLFAKIFRFTFLKIGIINRAVSSPRRGVGHRHQALGWDAVDAFVSARVSVRRMNKSVRRSRVVLTPRCWRQVGSKYAAGDGDNKPAHRGEREVSRKAIAQGMSECFRCPVCSCAPIAQLLAHETAGAACTRHSLRPLFEGGQRDGNSSGETRRENAFTCQPQRPQESVSESHVRESDGPVPAERDDLFKAWRATAAASPM
jgi:hypothetical protein